MIRMIDDNNKECIINEKFIVSVNKYNVVNGNGVALKVSLCHANYLGLWYKTEAGAVSAFELLEKAISKVK